MRWDDETPDDASTSSPEAHPAIDFRPIDAAGRMSKASATGEPADKTSGGFSFAPINYADRLKRPATRAAQSAPPRPQVMRPGERYGPGQSAYLYQLPPEELIPELPPLEQPTPARPEPTAAEAALPFAPGSAENQADALRAYQQQYWAHLQQARDPVSPASEALDVPAYLAKKPEPTHDPFAHTDTPVVLDEPTPAQVEDDLPKAVPVRQAVANAQAIPSYLQKKAGEASAEPTPAPRPERAPEPVPPLKPPPRAPHGSAASLAARPVRTLSSASMRHKKPPRPTEPKPPAEAPAHPTTTPRPAPARARAPIPPQPANRTPDKARIPRPPKPSSARMPLWKKIALCGCVAGIVACAVLVLLMVGSLLRNEQEVESMFNQYYQQNGQSLQIQSSRVALLPAGETYVPTATPVPVDTPTPVPKLEIRDGALGQLITPEPSEAPTPGQPYTLPPSVRTRPAPYANRSVRPEMALLRQQYPELVAWLTVGDLIDAPVAQGTNAYYRSHDARRKTNGIGAVYLDERYTLKTPPENLLLLSGNEPTLLGPIQGFRAADAAFLRQNGVFRLDTLYEEGQYAVFAAFDANPNPTHTDYFNYAGYVSFGSDGQFADYVQAARTHSLWAVGVDVQPGDRLVTLAVPNGDAEGTFLVLMARRLRDDEDAAALAEQLASVIPAQP